MDCEWKEFLKFERAKYMKLRYVICPAFDGEKVYFTDSGFSHLISKNRKLRDKSERIRRVTLCQYAPGIIKRSTTSTTHFINNNKKGVCISFWSMNGRVNGMDLTVIIRQIGDHPKHFFSIFLDRP